MPIRVIDKASQQELEVSADEAQAGILRGDFVVPDARVRITKGGRVGSVATADLAASIGAGARLVDDLEADELKLRAEESDVGSQLLGGLESAAAGATLGLSTAIEEGLGADPARMRARREGLGGLGTGLEVAGAIAPALLTGGGSAAASGAAGAARAGAAARGARGLLSASPAGLLARAGARVERGAAGLLPASTPGLVRTTVPVAGRGMVEGFVAGAGQELDESVLGEREITAERLLEAGGWGGLFGAGAGTIIPGAAAAGQGLGRVAVRPIRQVLSRAAGMTDDLGDRGIAAILGKRGSTQRQLFAEINGLDLSDVDEIADDLIARPDELHRYLTQANAVTEDLAASVRPAFEGLRGARRIAIREGSGAARLRDVSRHLPDDIDSLARIPSAGAKELERLTGTLSAEGRAIAGELSEVAPVAVKRATVLVNKAKVVIAAQARRAAANKASAKELAAVVHGQLDELKQGLDGIRADYSGIAANERTKATLKFLDDQVSPLRGHLSNELLYGEAGARHATRNDLMRRAIDAREQLSGASARLLDRRAPVDNADLLSVVRNSGRFAGATKTELLEDAIAAESDYLGWVLRHGDVDDATRKVMREQLASNKAIGKAIEAQRTKVRKLDILERWRGMEGNRSPSIGMFSTAGPLLGGLLGNALGGIPGALVGGTIGMATKPYTITRKMAAVLAHANGSEARALKAIGGVLRKIGGTAGEGARAGARAIGEGSRRALPVVAGDRRARLESVRATAARLAANPGLLADEQRKLTIDLDDDMPRLGKAVAAKSAIAVQYLAAHAPKGYAPPLGNGPVLIDPIELDAYERRVEATLTPARSLERIGTGTLTAEHIEALKAVWPAKYAEAQDRIFAAIAARGDKPLPLSVATQLSSLWSAPVDPTLQLAGGIAMAFAPAQIAQQQAAAAKGARASKPPKLELEPTRFDTPLDAATKASHA